MEKEHAEMIIKHIDYRLDKIEKDMEKHDDEHQELEKKISKVDKRVYLISVLLFLVMKGADHGTDILKGLLR